MPLPSEIPSSRQHGQGRGLTPPLGGTAYPERWGRTRRSTRLALAALFAATLAGVGPGVVESRRLDEVGPPSRAIESPATPVATSAGALVAPAADATTFLEGGAGQASACGGPGQRACCLFERLGPACDAGYFPANLGQFPNACGGLGAATCVPISQPTACGGEGQRACCSNESLEACQPGLQFYGDDAALDLYGPVSGDATCSNEPISGSAVPRSSGSCHRLLPAAIPEPTAAWTPPSEPRGVLRGYLDMHLHLLGHMAHGGRNLVGTPAPIGDDGGFTLDGSHTINQALSWTTDLFVHKNGYHGLINDTSGDGTQDGSRTPFGAPYFTGWPKWTSTTHQQTYYVWLERAWRGGLRATTLFASHVESLCKTSLKATRQESWPDCENSMRHIVDQLRMARDFERFIDGLSGGPGLGWFRIVTTPQAAREAVRAGKLAVVLGIEVDNLFNCKEAGCPADFGLPTALTNRPAPTTLEQAVDVIYDMGVRHVFPVHNFDNGFGAAATWMDAIGVGQVIAEQRWWEVEDCGTFNGGYGFWLDNVLYPLMLLIGFPGAQTPAIPPYVSGNSVPSYATCNRYGLRLDGQRLLTALMNKGMLIDVDHMGRRTLDQAIGFTSRGPDGNGEAYPLVASHVQAFDLHQMEFSGNRGRHERMRTRDQLDAIRNSGGLVAAMLKDDVQDTDLKGEAYTVPYAPQRGGIVANDCRHSSKTWAQLLQYLTDVMGGPVAMGSDFNGAAGHLGPRFGSDACGGWKSPNGFERPRQELDGNRLVYPFSLPGLGGFDRQVTGFKTFDYNTDGLAHVGLLPDLVADLPGIGVDPYYVDSVMCSAEAYIRVWERADAMGARRALPDPNRPWLCRVTDGTPPVSTSSLAPAANAAGWHNSDVTATISATDDDSGVDRIDLAVMAGGQTASSTTPGALAVTTLAGEGDVMLGHFATDVAGNVEAARTRTVRIDRTAPVISATRLPAPNAAGWNRTAVTVGYQCNDLLSGVASCPAPATLSAEGEDQSVSGTAEDVAGNRAAASVANIDIDLTPPVVTVTGVSDGASYPLGSVPAAGCTTTDALSGVATSATVAVTGGTSNGVGSFTAGCTGAADVAGNTRAAAATFTVRYVFTGFFAPVNNLPVVNSVNAGRTVPVKFALGGDHGLDVLAAASSVAVSCSSGLADPVELTVDNPGASVFFYDATSGGYQFNWKTEKAWAGTCRRLLVRLDDGSVHTADFRLQ